MQLRTLFDQIIAKPEVHARLLNTLSLMENTGARKISASEHSTDVTLIILKHAAEEHRHAYYLKKQINKIDESYCPTYHYDFLLAPASSRLYLNKLDTEVSRYLKSTLNLSGAELKFGAYLLVTYAIEVRADELYPVYQEALDAAHSRVNVKSIILEEEGHLEEMLKQLKDFSADWQIHAKKSLEIEAALFEDWAVALAAELNN
jgi:bacterioferritin (cytochrome b1)